MSADLLPEAALLDDLAASADLKSKVVQAWQEFAAAVTTAIPDVPAGTHVDLALDPTASGTGDAVYGVTLEIGKLAVTEAELARTRDICAHYLEMAQRYVRGAYPPPWMR